MERLRNTTSNIQYYIALAIVGCLYLLLAWNTTPTLSDDMVYDFKWTMDGEFRNPVLISSLKDVVESMHAHYLIVNGRYIGSFLAQVFLSFVPKHVLDVVNAFLFVLLVHLSLVFLKVKSHRLVMLGIFVSLLFVFVYGFQSALLWDLGTFNYLWILIPTLAFFIYLQHYGANHLRWYHWQFAIVAILIGWGHEGLGVPLCFGFAVYAIQHRHTFFRSQAFPLMLFYAVGTTLCFSPAVFGRIGNEVSIFSRLVTGGTVIVLLSRILWLLLATMVVLWIKQRNFLIERIKTNLWLFAACFVSYAIAFSCGENTPRVNFYSEFMALLLLVDLLGAASWHFRRYASVVLSVLAIAVYIPALYCCHMQTGDYEYALKQMETPGQTLIKTHNTKPRGKIMRFIYWTYVVPFATYGDLQPYMGFDISDSNERCAAAKYHKPFMMFLPERLANDIENGKVSSSHFNLYSSDNLYALKVKRGRKVESVAFNLKDEIPDTLKLYQRPVIYKGNTWIPDDFHWKVIDVEGNSILVVTKPMGKIFRRIKNISIK